MYLFVLKKGKKRKKMEQIWQLGKEIGTASSTTTTTPSVGPAFTGSGEIQL